MGQWQACFGRWAARFAAKPGRRLARLAGRYGLSDAGDDVTLLFAVQTYYATLVKLLAERFGLGPLDEGLPDNPFRWCEAARSKAVGCLADRLRQTLAGYRLAPPTGDGECDLLKPLYQDLFPRALRHQLGEYYTPDWLAAHVLDQVGYTGEPGQRLLDPACGSGTFLLMALRRLQQARDEGRGTGNKGLGIRDWGLGIGARNLERSLARWFPIPSPLAPCPSPRRLRPESAGRNDRTGELLDRDGRPAAEERTITAPIHLRDSILGGHEGEADREPFDFVVGNPPWIAWDNLPEEDRRATRPLWERYGLFSLSGRDARHGGGKKDLAMLMLYAAADRYLKPGGRLGMVVPQTLFQTRGAGDGFRRFQLGADGPPLGVLRVDDMVALRPFGDAANWTSTIVLEKGTATVYPVPYFVWGKAPENDECRMMNDECLARPIDPARPTSPWLVETRVQGSGVRDQGAGTSDFGFRTSDFGFACSDLCPLTSGPFYSAHLGANSGGANGVYWVKVLGPADGGVLVRNVTAKSKRTIETVQQVIEPDLLYPLLRWGDVGAGRPCRGTIILLAQDPATRTGIAEALMRERFPRTLAYLERFRDLLVSRAAYRRYQRGGPFYSMYNVGPYTIAPIKVVWRRMDRRINAAVVEVVDNPLQVRRRRSAGDVRAGGVRVVGREAHYLCAVLNSEAVNQRVAAHSVRGGKGFGTPGMLEYVPLGPLLGRQPAARGIGRAKPPGARALFVLSPFGGEPG